MLSRWFSGLKAWGYVAVAACAALCAILFRRRHGGQAKESAPQKGVYEATKAVVNEQAASTQQAGEALAENLAGTPDDRAARVLEWLRKRQAR